MSSQVFKCRTAPHLISILWQACVKTSVWVQKGSPLIFWLPNIFRHSCFLLLWVIHPKTDPISVCMCVQCVQVHPSSSTSTLSPLFWLVGVGWWHRPLLVSELVRLTLAAARQSRVSTTVYLQLSSALRFASLRDNYK